MPKLSHLLFSFKGRIDRTLFWEGNVLLAGFLALTAIAAFFSAVAPLGLGFADPNSGLINPQSQIQLLVAVALLLAALDLWIILALAVKRLHDRDRPGAWALALIAIPPLGLIWWVVELGTWRGTTGPNRYGVAPSKS